MMRNFNEKIVGEIGEIGSTCTSRFDPALDLAEAGLDLTFADLAPVVAATLGRQELNPLQEKRAAKALLQASEEGVDDEDELVERMVKAIRR